MCVWDSRQNTSRKKMIAFLRLYHERTTQNHNTLWFCKETWQNPPQHCLISFMSRWVGVYLSCRPIRDDSAVNVDVILRRVCLCMCSIIWLTGKIFQRTSERSWHHSSSAQPEKQDLNYTRAINCHFWFTKDYGRTIPCLLAACQCCCLPVFVAWLNVLTANTFNIIR